MTLSGKLKQKIGDGGLREMWDETKWMLTYIRRYRFVIMIHILLGIVGSVFLSLFQQHGHRLAESSIHLVALNILRSISVFLRNGFHSHLLCIYKLTGIGHNSVLLGKITIDKD